MDELNNSFGRLSTSAAEWKPPGEARQQRSVDSDLRASAVKEFVPGQGWTAVQERQQHAPLSSAEDVSAEYGPSTVPSGPEPSPLPAFRALHALGMSDDLWRYHRNLALESTRQMDPSDERHKAVPLPYCNAYCLDQQQRGRSSFGYPTATFQVTNRDDGYMYCLRRFDSVRSVSPKIAAAVSDRWSNCTPVQEHPGVVPFHLCFLSQRAVFFVHQYIPGARSLKERLQGPLSETVVWSCITQLVSAMRTIHGNNLAVRTLDWSHVLSNADSMESRLRLRINCLGVVDALEFEARKRLSDMQMEDIRALGRLSLAIATGTEIDLNTDNETMRHCEAFLAQNFSPELHNLVMTLIKSTHPPIILDIARAVAQRSFDEQDAAYRSLDRSEASLAAEYESGRALRILLKLGFINERPEFGQNRRWAQSGDCYVLSLFRDYVFHQADGAGTPVMDLGHVITALNKLDAADDEKIVLCSRDGNSVMVVSYADVARCLENAFYELLSGSLAPAALQY